MLVSFLWPRWSDLAPAARRRCPTNAGSLARNAPGTPITRPNQVHAYDEMPLRAAPQPRVVQRRRVLHKQHRRLQPAMLQQRHPRGLHAVGRRTLRPSRRSDRSASALVPAVPGGPWRGLRRLGRFDRQFRNRQGRPLTRFGVRYILRKHARAASAASKTLAAKRVHPHVIRHNSEFRIIPS